MRSKVSFTLLAAREMGVYQLPSPLFERPFHEQVEVLRGSSPSTASSSTI